MLTMDDNKIISGKMARTLMSTGLAAKTGVKHLRYMHAKRSSDQPEVLQKKHEEDIGKLLFNGLSQMRGTALKASQLLSLETDLIPEGVRKELAKSCYQVPPINKALVRKVFLQEFDTPPTTLFASFSPEAFAAASLGQVHKGQIRCDPIHGNQIHGEQAPADTTDVAIKVQYPGIGTSIDSDLRILSLLISTASKTTKLMPKKNVIDITLDEISICLRDEVNYVKEAENTKWFKDNLKIINLRIPEVFPDYSSSRILTTELLHGKHVDEWLATKPSQEQRNIAGQTVFNTFLVSAFDLKALHADPHPGNYLFLDNGEVALLDFGCIKHLSERFVNSMEALIKAILNGDHDAAFNTYKTLGLLAEGLPFDEYYQHVYPILEPLQQWMATPFRTSEYDFSELPPLPANTSHSQHKEAIKHVNGVARDQMYFDRTYVGLYLLLKKIGAVVGTENPWLFTEVKSLP